MLKPLDPHRCPVEQALELIAGKWKSLILWRLSAGTLRHGELRRSVHGVTQRMLTLHLRELERDGLIVRTVFPQVPPRVEYALTPAARTLMPTMAAFGDWLLAHHAQLNEPATPRSATFADPLDAVTGEAANDAAARHGIRRIRMSRAPRGRLGA